MYELFGRGKALPDEGDGWHGGLLGLVVGGTDGYQEVTQMAYAPFHYPPGYADFTRDVFVFRRRLDDGLEAPEMVTRYPLEEYVNTYGAETCKEWIANYCEIGTPHENKSLRDEVVASIQRIVHRDNHAARSDRERYGG